MSFDPWHEIPRVFVIDRDFINLLIKELPSGFTCGFMELVPFAFVLWIFTMNAEGAYAFGIPPWLRSGGDADFLG